MYLGRAKKHIEEQDMKDLKEKEAKHAERMQRQPPGKSSEPEAEENGAEFRPEELPDGSCHRPKNVLDSANDGETAIRPAEYIGSFSVSGESQSTRTEFVQTTLESMHTVEKSKNVLLVISLSGVKVCSKSGDSVYMAHALKRISYAACDPEHCQFAFLAREPKGHINIQFCHAFITNTAEQAEELNTIIGNAFKMAYAQQKTRQPTFNELIEIQLVEQKAQFTEYQQQAQMTLQKKLTEIATPTALQRMEQRRLSSSDDTSGASSPSSVEREYIVGKNKVWYSLTRHPYQQAKHAADRVEHRSPIRDPSAQGSAQGPLRCDSPTFSSRPSNSNQSHNSRKSDPAFTPTKRNSTPIQLSPAKSNSNSNSPKRNSSPQVSPFQNFQVVTIRESLENNVNNSNRFKGSPVTALKDEIDRRFSNGGLGTLDSGLGMGVDDMDSFRRIQSSHVYNNEDQSPVSTPSKMSNRPLPALPAMPALTGDKDNMADHRASPRLRNWTSLDDDVIPHHTRTALQSGPRNSPKRRPQRPQSEIFLDSNKDIDHPSVYIYGFKSQTQPQLSPSTNLTNNNSNMSPNSNVSSPNSNFSSPNSNFLPNFTPSPKSPYTPTQLDSRPTKPRSSGYDSMRMGYDNVERDNKSSPPLHFQNGSPTCQLTTNNAATETSPVKAKGAGLESLMGLDRSHIEDETLRQSSWYQTGIPRDVALEILQQEDIGSFIVRDSSTHPGCYALSVRVPKFENPTGISHYLVLKTHRGVKLKGLEKEWPSLLSLVTHHSVMSEMLPCTLRLPRNTNNPTFKGSDRDEKDEDPDYQRLADFSSMMAALKT